MKNYDKFDQELARLEKEFRNIIKEQLRIVGFDAEVSPNTEASILKFISPRDVQRVRNELKQIYPDVQFRTRYRGPRYDKFRANCLRKDAKYASIYLK